MPEPAELDLGLIRLAAEVEWPATPNLAPRVRSRIAVSRQWYDNRWAVAAAAVILALAALLAYTPTRTAIADWLNLHTIFQRVSTLPSPSPQPSGPLGVRLGLGGKTTLQAAQGSASWKILVPATLGQPDEVYLEPVAAGPPQGEVSLVYASRPGIPVAGTTGIAVLVTEARGSVDANFFGKTLGPGTTVEPVTVAGHQGYWISGAPHDFFLLDANGEARDETLRLATNTLLIDEGGTIVRIEGNLTKQQAEDIAASLG